MEHNEVAYLKGGRRRVALVALFMLVHDGRLRLSPTGKLYAAPGAESGDPLEAAVLAQRSTLPEALAALAKHESVRALEEDLVRRGLVRRGWLGLMRRPTATGRRAIEDATRKRGLALKIALEGVTAIHDKTLRSQFGVATGSRGSLRGQGRGGWDAARADDGGMGSGGGGNW